MIARFGGASPDSVTVDVVVNCAGLDAEMRGNAT
jgi:hypothetical protein